MALTERPRTSIVRVPARDRHDRVVCAECGRLVDQEPKRQRIENPTLADGFDNPNDREELVAGSLEELHVGGWRCDGHRYDVVMPITFYGEEPALPPSFDAVELVYADQEARWVVVRLTDRPAPWP